MSRLFKALELAGYGPNNPITIDAWSFDRQIAGHREYIGTNALFHDGRLLIDVHAITTTEAGLATKLNGLTGRDWNEAILTSALKLAFQATAKGRDIYQDQELDLDGDPVIGDGYYGRNRGYDYLHISPFFRAEGYPQTTLDDAQYGFGYGSTDAWGTTKSSSDPSRDMPTPYMYGAFSPMIANHVISTRHASLIPDLQGWADKSREEKADLRGRVGRYILDYESLSPPDVKAIVDYASGRHGTSVYGLHQSIIQTGKQNIEFMKAMERNPAARPVLSRIASGQHQREFVRAEPFDNDAIPRPGFWRNPAFGTDNHRTNFNLAAGVSQNINAGLLTGAVAGENEAEFDFMETAGKDGESGMAPGRVKQGADNEVVVVVDDTAPGSEENPSFDPRVVGVHDGETNRNSAEYGMAPRRSIENNNSTYFYDHMVMGNLNPTAATPTLESGGNVKAQGMDDVLSFISELLPWVTISADARNDAPLGTFKLLADRRRDVPESPWDDFIATKVYGYSLAGGFGPLAEKYQERYGLTKEQAAADLRPANVIPVMGEGQARPKDVGYATTLTSEAVQRVTPQQYFGQPLEPEVQAGVADDALDYLDFGLSFVGNTNIAGFQLPSLPSEATLRTTTPPHPMKAMQLARSAATLATIKGIRDGSIRAASTTNPDLNLADEVNRIRLGVSDRFADFYVAPRDKNGRVVDTVKLNELNEHTEPGLRRFYYKGPTPTEEVGFEQILRGAIGRPDADTPVLRYEAPISFATTDVPTDLRAQFMGVLGAGSIPATVRHHPHAVLTNRAVDNNPTDWKLPAWTQAFAPRSPEKMRHQAEHGLISLLDQIAEVDPYFRNRVRTARRIATDLDNYENSSTWLNSFVSAPSFRNTVQAMAVNNTTLRFSGDGAIAIPFSSWRNGHPYWSTSAASPIGFYLFGGQTGSRIVYADAWNKWRTRG
jgi:hypothetical protein